MENKSNSRGSKYDSIDITFGCPDGMSEGISKPAYRILFRRDYKALALELEALGMAGRRFMIVTDSNVAGLYLEECLDVIKPVAKYSGCFIFEAGEESKNLSTVNLYYKRLIEAGFDRNDVILALGGGVAGDLAGFAAATYLRGIRFIQLPTSLLAMVDSSIGGKTGVDYEGYKNMIGAFYQPKLVYINLSVLNTLPDSQFVSGMAEIIKHGLIKDRAYFEWLKASRDKILAKDYEALSEMIYKSCHIKKEVVERDPKETGERALLNFGHTIGHSIEKFKGFDQQSAEGNTQRFDESDTQPFAESNTQPFPESNTQHFAESDTQHFAESNTQRYPERITQRLTLSHGECVSIGIAAASYICLRRGYIDKAGFEGILKTLSDFGAPVHTSGLTIQEVYEATRLDKKMDADKIKFILINGIGNAFIDTSVSPEELKDAIEYVIG